MQVALAVALAVLYVGITLTLGNIPSYPILLWFFAPAGVTIVVGFAAQGISAILPLPWSTGRRYEPPPRRVHLSWRAAVRVPASLPWLCFPWFALSSLPWTQNGLLWVKWIVGALALALLARLARRIRREFRLLRCGDVGMALVLGQDSSTDSSEMDRIDYRFTAADGTAVVARGWDRGYGIPVGSEVPVFYVASNPRDHIVASGSWLEAD